MTDAEIARITELATTSTPGPWKANRDHIYKADCRTGMSLARTFDPCDIENAAFIAAARDAVPALLAMVADLTAQRDHARAWAHYHYLCGCHTLDTLRGIEEAEPEPTQPRGEEIAGDGWDGFLTEFDLEEEATP